MIYCTNCGTQLPDGAKFCSSCGTPVINAAPPQSAQIDLWNQLLDEVIASYKAGDAQKGIELSTVLINKLETTTEFEMVSLPDQSKIYKSRGNCYKAIGNLDKAIEDSDKAVTIDPNNADALWNSLLYKSQAAYNAGEIEKAIEFRTILINKIENTSEFKTIPVPDHAGIYLNRGLYYVNIRNLNKAIEDFDKAATLDPHNANALWNSLLYKSQAAYNAGEIEKAIEFCTIHINKIENTSEFKTIPVPDHAGIYLNRGLYYVNIGNLNKAIEDFDKAVTLDPHNADALFSSLFYKAGAAEDAGEIEKAIEFHTILINKLETTTEFKISLSAQSIIYAGRGRCYEEIGNLNKAIEDLDKAVALNPHNARALWNSLNCKLYAAVDADESEKVMEFCTIIINKIENTSEFKTISDPTTFGVYANRAAGYERLNNIPAAIADWDKAIALIPKNPEFYRRKGQDLLQLKKYDEAISVYTKAIELDPNMAGGFGGRGVSYLCLGKRENAVQDLQRAFDLDPNGEYRKRHLDVAKQMLTDEKDKKHSERMDLVKDIVSAVVKGVVNGLSDS